jgi:hypothetical protein
MRSWWGCLVCPHPAIAQGLAQMLFFGGRANAAKMRSVCEKKQNVDDYLGEIARDARLFRTNPKAFP